MPSGGALMMVLPGAARFRAPIGGRNFALSEAAPVESRGHVDHMGIQVESAEIVTRELTRVKAAGLPVREEMGVNCCHANQDKFWVEDPDGVEWEVYVLNYDLEDTGLRATAAPAPSGLAV